MSVPWNLATILLPEDELEVVHDVLKSVFREAGEGI
jgi:hypothetical protein